MRSRSPISDDDRISVVDILRVRSFAAMLGAETQSTLGDQLARVALSVLIYDRTGSPAETALTYALTFLPAILGGSLLSGVADRYSRRVVMIGVDLCRAGLLACMALPGLPTIALFGLLIIAVFLGPLFTSAEVSLIATVLEGEPYRVATGVRIMTNQFAQVAGFAIGGAVVAATNPRAALVVDAGTFLLSAVIVGLVVREVSTSYGRHSTPEAPTPTSLPATLRALWRERPIRTLIGFSWLVGFFVTPEALAAPFAAHLGGGTLSVGLLLTAIPFGSVLGAFVVLKMVSPQVRQRIIAPMAVLAGLPLIGCVADPPIAIAAALWALSGVFAAYQLDVLTVIFQSVGSAWRGRTASILNTGLLASQGGAFVVFGLIANSIGADVAIATAGGTGSLAAVAIWLARSAANARSARTGMRPTLADGTKAATLVEG